MCRWTIPRCVPLPRCWRKCPKYDDGGGERRWRHQNFGCYGVELMGLAPRVACAEHGVVVAQVPWAEPGSRFTRDFEMERAWLTAVANQKTVSGFLRIAWRTASHIARRVAARLALDAARGVQAVRHGLQLVELSGLDPVVVGLRRARRMPDRRPCARPMRGVRAAAPARRTRPPAWPR